ncbi:hypothetical protein NSQ55_21330 [Paenibacillus sp. FSL H7-0943]
MFDDTTIADMFCEVEVLGTNPKEYVLHPNNLSENEIINDHSEDYKEDNAKLFIIRAYDGGRKAVAVRWSEKEPFWNLFEYVNKVRSAIDNDQEENEYVGEDYQIMYHYTAPKLSIPNIHYFDRKECARDVRSIIYSTRKALDELESFINKVAPIK